MQATSRLKNLAGARAGQAGRVSLGRHFGARAGREGSEDERADTPLGVRVARADALREVDDDDLALLAADEQVELVEVAVDEAGPGKADDEGHELGVELAGRVVLGQLPERVGVDERHEDRVPRVVDRRRHGEAGLVEDLRAQRRGAGRSVRRRGSSLERGGVRCTLRNAHSLCAASRDMYIQLALLRLPM